jgi:hypothetical protein
MGMLHCGTDGDPREREREMGTFLRPHTALALIADIGGA